MIIEFPIPAQANKAPMSKMKAESTAIGVKRPKTEAKIKEGALAFVDTATFIVEVEQGLFQSPHEKKIYDDLIEMSVPLLFPQALEHGSIDVAYSLLEKAYKHRLEGYSAMKEQFINYIDDLLDRSPQKSVDSYRDYLQTIRKNVMSGSFAGVFEKRAAVTFAGLSDEDSAGLERLVDVVQRETIIPVVFENSLANNQVDIAFHQLSKAREMKIPQYEALKDRFIKYLDDEMRLNDDEFFKKYRERLIKIKERVVADNWS